MKDGEEPKHFLPQHDKEASCCREENEQQIEQQQQQQQQQQEGNNRVPSQDAMPPEIPRQDEMSGHGLVYNPQETDSRQEMNVASDPVFILQTLEDPPTTTTTTNTNTVTVDEEDTNEYYYYTSLNSHYNSTESTIDDDDDDEDYDETQSREEVFYADGSCGQLVNEMDECEHETHSDSGGNGSTIDFHSLAQRALQTLEMEYHDTVQSGQSIVHANSMIPEECVSSHDACAVETEYLDSEDPKNVNHAFGREMNDVKPSAGSCLESQCPSTKSHPQACLLPKSSPIDTSAIAKAMRNISLSSSTSSSLSLEKKFQKWKPSHPSYMPLLIPPVHPLIPTKPLLAFKRHSSEKAKAATSNLTRSATLAEAIARLFLPATDNHSCCNLDNDEWKDWIHVGNKMVDKDDLFVIHCIGADRVECQTRETIQKTFQPLVKWIHEYEHFLQGMNQPSSLVRENDSTHDSSMTPHIDIHAPPLLHFSFPKKLRIELLGPNVPLHSKQYGILSLLPNTPGRLESATVVCRNCLYHDYLTQCNNTTHSAPPEMNESSHSNLFQYPNIIIAYNAGIWGYTDWHPTLKALCNVASPIPIPFVITAYTLYEAEDDAQVMDEFLEEMKQSSNSGSSTKDRKRCLWTPELNPYASKIVRETKSSDNTYYENGAWQAYLMGKY